MEPIQVVKTYNCKEAIALIQNTGQTLVGRGDYIRRAGGYNGHVLMCGEVDTFTGKLDNTVVKTYWSTVPQGYMIEINRPNFLYGNEGFLFTRGLEYIGRLDTGDFEDVTNEQLELLPEDGHFWGYRDQYDWERFNPYMEGFFNGV